MIDGKKVLSWDAKQKLFLAISKVKYAILYMQYLSNISSGQ